MVSRLLCGGGGFGSAWSRLACGWLHASLFSRERGEGDDTAEAEAFAGPSSENGAGPPGTAGRRVKYITLIRESSPLGKNGGNHLWMMPFHVVNAALSDEKLCP